jgi:phosphocarrier protein HPr
MVRAETEILNKLGLHARASAKLTQLASHFRQRRLDGEGARRINAKSIMGVMMLAAGKGSTVIVETDGAVTSRQASEAILELIADRFGEAE